MYLYLFDNGNPINLDSLPTVTILDANGTPIPNLTPTLEICQKTKGVYEATNSTSDLSWFSTNYKFVLNYSYAKQAAQAEESISEGPIKEIRKSSSSIFLDKGIVIYYSSETDSILFSSVETFLKYSEAVGVYNSTLSVKYNYFESGTKFYDNYLNPPVYF